MGDENGGSRGFWPREDEVVPLASATAVIAHGANGDRAEGDRSEERPLARSSRLSAGEFTPERMIRPSTEAPARGAPRAIRVVGRTRQDRTEPCRGTTAG